MLTPIGKALRTMRMDRGLMLKDMADGIGVSSAFLSAVETGRKPVPSDLIDRIAQWRGLDRETIAMLRRAVEQSANEVRLKFPPGMAAEDRETAAVLAREFGTLTPDDFAELREILHRRRA